MTSVAFESLELAASQADLTSPTTVENRPQQSRILQVEGENLGPLVVRLYCFGGGTS